LSLAPTSSHQTNSGARAWLDLGLGRRGIFIWAAVILFSNHLSVLIKELPSPSLENLVSSLGVIGIFQCMAWYAIFRLLQASNSTIAGRLRDAVIAASLSLLTLLPTNRMIWVAASGFAMYWCIFSEGDVKLRAAGSVLAALSVQQLWGHVLFNLIAMPLLRAEAAAVATMLDVVRPGTMSQDNVITGPNGFGLVVYAACSSFHNLSLAMLCWVTVSSLPTPDLAAPRSGRGRRGCRNDYSLESPAALSDGIE
jgi:hypothetical protein